MQKIVICLMACVGLLASSVSCKSISSTQEELLIPSYKEIAPIAIFHANGTPSNNFLQQHLKNHSANLVKSIDDEIEKNNRFIILEVVATKTTPTVIDNEYATEYLLIVSITPSPFIDATGKIQTFKPRYFKVSFKSFNENDEYHETLVKKLLATPSFIEVLKNFDEA